jgi:GNAT superfamily N-acetyltransferase
MNAPAERAGGMSSPLRQMIGDEAGYLPVPIVTRRSSSRTSSRHDEAACVRELPDGACIVAGNAGDHPLVLQLLVETHHAAFADDFQTRLDEPNYRPTDRLLLRRDRDLLAHIHVANHFAWFAGQRVPIVTLEDFAALPEFSHAGYEGELLDSAETLAAGEGAVIAIALADAPEQFVRRQWSLVRGQGHTRANARSVLAHLDSLRAAQRRHRKPSLEIRTWRHFELDDIRHIYEQTAANLWGPQVRSEDAWQWAIGRKAQDQILIAVDIQDASPEDSASDLLRAGGKVVGYAIVRGACIVEMATLPDFAGARAQLLARACQDAMDRDHNDIALCTPSSDPAHELLALAGGSWISDEKAARRRWVLKVLSPEKWVERMFPTWHEHARLAGVERPLEIGFAVGDVRYRFTLTRRSSKLERVTGLVERHVECSRSAFDSLLVGNMAVQSAVAAGHLRLSHADLAGPLGSVFPPRLFWQSALETLRL